MKLTTNQRKRQRKAIRKAIKHSGTQETLALQLTIIMKRKVTQQTISDLLRKGMAAHWAIPIHRVTGVSLNDLHPVVYPKSVL